MSRPPASWGARGGASPGGWGGGGRGGGVAWGAGGVVVQSRGGVEATQPKADLNEGIAYYSEALALQPAQTAALNNRGVAYLERGSSGDLERAEADLRQAVS